jgi:hypothetical protein
MRCGKARRRLLEADAVGRPPALEDHFQHCPDCAAFEQDWGRLRTGLRRAAQDPPPEPSFGFATRLAFRLQAALAEQRAGALFLERAGRRSVYAALVAALLLVLAVLVPRSGPVRAPSTADIYLAEPEAVAARDYPIFPGQSFDTDYQFPAPLSGGR